MSQLDKTTYLLPIAFNLSNQPPIGYPIQTSETPSPFVDDSLLGDHGNIDPDTARLRKISDSDTLLGHKMTSSMVKPTAEELALKAPILESPTLVKSRPGEIPVPSGMASF